MVSRKRRLPRHGLQIDRLVESPVDEGPGPPEAIFEIPARRLAGSRGLVEPPKKLGPIIHSLPKVGTPARRVKGARSPGKCSFILYVLTLTGCMSDVERARTASDTEYRIECRYVEDNCARAARRACAGPYRIVSSRIQPGAPSAVDKDPESFHRYPDPWERQRPPNAYEQKRHVWYVECE